MLQTYEGYWDNGRVLSLNNSPIKITGHPKVLITVLDDIEKRADKIEKSKTFWTKFDNLVKNSSKEKLNIKDFPRIKTERKLIDFSIIDWQI